MTGPYMQVGILTSELLVIGYGRQLFDHLKMNMCTINFAGMVYLWYLLKNQKPCGSVSAAEE